MPQTTVATEKTHAASIIAYRWAPDNSGVQFLVIAGERTGITIAKFPGGMGNPGEDPPQTAWREFLEETGYHNVASFFGPVCRFEVGNHSKVFFACHGTGENLVGQSRQEKICDKEEGQSDDEGYWLHPPRWADSGEILVGNFAKHHRQALIVALPKIAEEDPEFKELALKDPALAPLLR